MGTKQKVWKPKKPYLSLRARSRRLELRPYRFSDFKAWRTGHLGRCEKKNRFDGDKPNPRTLTKARFRKVVLLHRQWAKKRDMFQFGIFERGSGRIVGMIGYNMISKSYSWANLGYGIHNQHWGKGFGPEAAKLCLEIGFRDLDIFRIEASCEPGNEPSAKVALRAGLRPEGRRAKFPIRTGPVDLLVFAQNQIDFRKRHGRE